MTTAEQHDERDRQIDERYRLWLTRKLGRDDMSERVEGYLPNAVSDVADTLARRDRDRFTPDERTPQRDERDREIEHDERHRFDRRPGFAPDRRVVPRPRDRADEPATRAPTFATALDDLAGLVQRAQALGDRFAITANLLAGDETAIAVEAETNNLAPSRHHSMPQRFVALAHELRLALASCEQQLSRIEHLN